jgi:hypothetical protein
LGSIALELGLVASGQLQYAMFSSPKVWDVAAGVLLVQESGGEVWSTRAGYWAPFESFNTRGVALRHWRGSLVAGEGEAVRRLLNGTRLRVTPVERIERLAGPAAALRVERGARRTLRLAHRLPRMARRRR